MKKKVYKRPQLIQYGDLSTLTRGNPSGVGMPDGGGGGGKQKGQWKTG